MGKLTVISKKIKKITQEKKTLTRKLSFEKRKARKIKLIKLGTLFSIVNLLEESQEKIVAFLEKYRELSSSTKNSLRWKGKKILKDREHIDYSQDIVSRKRMLFLMIRKAALLEKLKIHLEDPNVILGYLSQYELLSLEEKAQLQFRGEKILQKEIIKEENKIISDEEKIRLLRLSISSNVDITKLLKEEFSTTIHSVRKFQYDKILKNLQK